MLISLDVGFGHMGAAIWHKDTLVSIRRFEFPKTKDKKVRSSSDRIDRASRWTQNVYDYMWEHGVEAVIGELPTGGSKSQNAAVEMNCATVMCGSLCTLMELPCEWCTPNDVKKGMTGKLAATKQEVIDAVIQWRPTLIDVEHGEKGRITYRVRTTNGVFKFPKTKFDDVADALAVYKVMNTSNMVKMFG